VAAMRALPGSESGRFDAAGGAGGLDWVAGPAGLVGLKQAFVYAGPVKVQHLEAGF
jgi:hypothetical protein